MQNIHHPQTVMSKRLVAQPNVPHLLRQLIHRSLVCLRRHIPHSSHPSSHYRRGRIVSLDRSGLDRGRILHVPRGTPGSGISSSCCGAGIGADAELILLRSVLTAAGTAVRRWAVAGGGRSGRWRCYGLLIAALVGVGIAGLRRLLAVGLAVGLLLIAVLGLVVGRTLRRWGGHVCCGDGVLMAVPCVGGDKEGQSRGLLSGRE